MFLIGFYLQHEELTSPARRSGSLSWCPRGSPNSRGPVGRREAPSHWAGRRGCTGKVTSFQCATSRSERGSRAVRDRGRPLIRHGRSCEKIGLPTTTDTPRSAEPCGSQTHRLNQSAMGSRGPWGGRGKNGSLAHFHARGTAGVQLSLRLRVMPATIWCWLSVASSSSC